MTSETSVLLIEDEPYIRRFVRAALEEEHCRVLEANDGRSGLREAGTRRPDLAIIDLGLPDIDGADVVRELRGWSDLPILILSARSDEGDKIAALDAGADDYLTKPFGIGELLARTRALLRRTRPQAGSACTSFGEVTVDFSRRTVRRAGQVVHLTPIEYRLLCILVANAGKVLTHRTLMREVWGPAYADSSHYLRIYMSHLRQKLETDPAQPAHLRTETGVGYRFVP